MKFVLYEIWTTAKVVEAKDLDEAYIKCQPLPRTDLNLSNWHIVPVDSPWLTQIKTEFFPKKDVE